MAAADFDKTEQTAQLIVVNFKVAVFVSVVIIPQGIVCFGKLTIVGMAGVRLVGSVAEQLVERQNAVMWPCAAVADVGVEVA